MLYKPTAKGAFDIVDKSADILFIIVIVQLKLLLMYGE